MDTTLEENPALETIPPSEQNFEKSLPNPTTENGNLSQKNNAVWMGSVLLLIVFVLLGAAVLLFKNRTENNMQKQVSTEEKVQTNSSSSSSFSELATSEVMNTLTTLPSSTILLSPTITSTPKPSATPTPKNDLQLTQVNIKAQYSSAIDTTYNSQGSPETYTYEEHIGINAFYVADTVKNNSPGTLTNIKRQLWINGKLESEKTIDQLAASEEKNFADFYLPQSPGTYTIEIKINPDRVIAEKNYANNNLTRTFTVINDKTSPNIQSIDVSRDNTNQQTCLGFLIYENVSQPNQMKYYEKLDSEDLHEITWDHSVEKGYERCLSGPPGESHTYSLKVIDNRGNSSEKTLTFQLLSF